MDGLDRRGFVKCNPEPPSVFASLIFDRLDSRTNGQIMERRLSLDAGELNIGKWDRWLPAGTTYLRKA